MNFQNDIYTVDGADARWPPSSWDTAFPSTLSAHRSTYHPSLENVEFSGLIPMYDGSSHFAEAYNVPGSETYVPTAPGSHDQFTHFAMSRPSQLQWDGATNYLQVPRVHPSSSSSTSSSSPSSSSNTLPTPSHTPSLHPPAPAEAHPPPSPQPQKICSHCHATSTPLWRRNPATRRPLCNACGLYLQQRNMLRPQALIDADNDSLSPSDEEEDNDPAYTGPRCSHCHTRRTSVWRRGKGGAKICNACGVYARLRGKERPLALKRNKIKPRLKHRKPGLTWPAEPAAVQ